MDPGRDLLLVARIPHGPLQGAFSSTRERGALLAMNEVTIMVALLGVKITLSLAKF